MERPFPFSRIRIAHVTGNIFRENWETFKKFINVQTSFTDAVTITVMQAANISLVMSFDEDFDRIPGIMRIYA